MLGLDTERVPGGDPHPGPSAEAREGGATDRIGRRLMVDAAAVLGAAGLAVTQPVLELFGDNPTFFVAGDYTTAQIVAFALAVALGPGLAAAAITAPFRFAGPRFGAAAHGLAVGAFAGAFALVACRTLGVGRTVPAFAAAGALAVVTAVAEARWRHVRTFLAYLAGGNLAFLALFLLASPTADALWSSGEADLGTVAVPPLQGPVVIVVLDELPLTALLRPDGTINAERYPNFGRLGAQSTWFRDAASESSETYVSIPTLLTGVRAGEDQAPTLAEHPRNYFTLFGDRYPARHYSPVTAMCPDHSCPQERAQSLGRMLADASVVYRHRVLPTALRAGLPRIDDRWGGFGDDIGVHASRTVSGGVNPWGQADELEGASIAAGDQLAVLTSEIAEIGPEPSVNYLHVMAPHTPYQTTPWGGMQADIWEVGEIPAEPSDVEASIYRDVVALQAMQIGAVDAALGAAIDSLERAGAWDDALVVVASDHGIDSTPPTFGREPDGGNADELLRIPLFVKAPGQTAGEIRDDPASTVDVLPSIVDLLGIETDWDFEGHSLFDGSEPEIERTVPPGLAPAREIAARRAEQFPAGDGWEALAAVGPAAGLVGDAVADHGLGPASPLRWAPDGADLLADLDTAGPVPYLLRGAVEGAGDEPVALVVALNRRIAGAVESYGAEGGGRWRVSGVMAPYFRDGRNDVAAYEVERSGHRVVLRPVGGG
ncbi:MAG TPA: sulfatase-like hydrolase/transferase [Acidimicrobiales bacterium]